MTSSLPLRVVANDSLRLQRRILAVSQDLAGGEEATFKVGDITRALHNYFDI
jgi:hypothetical protein